VGVHAVRRRLDAGQKLVGRSTLNRRFGERVQLSADGGRALVASNGSVAAWAFAPHRVLPGRGRARGCSCPVPESAATTGAGGFGVTMSADGRTALLSGFLAGSLTGLAPTAHRAR